MTISGPHPRVIMARLTDDDSATGPRTKLSEDPGGAAIVLSEHSRDLSSHHTAH